MSPGDEVGPAREVGPAGDATGVLVVGYGNTLRSDDGVGPAVAARLASDPRLRGADVRAEHQLAPELAVDVSRASLVVLVDAAVDDDPGSVRVRRVDPGAADPGVGWSHQVDPTDLAALVRELWGTAPPVVVVSVGTETVEVGEGLSPAVEAAVPRAIDAVAALVREHTTGAHGA